MRTSALALSSRTMRLTVLGSVAALLMYLAVSTVIAVLDAEDRIADLRASYASAGAQGTAAEIETPPSGPISRRALIASSKEAAVSSLQSAIQQAVEVPAKLESLHILDSPDEEGLQVVQASIRIRGLAPEGVATLVRRIEGSSPAILFDDLRISIHIRPAVFGSSGPGAGLQTSSAELGGVVRTYAMNAADRPQ